MRDTNTASNPEATATPRIVRISKQTITSGVGGFPSVGYGAAIYELATGALLATTRIADDWQVAGKRLAKRRGYDVRVVDAGLIWYVDGVRLVHDGVNGLVIVRDLHGRELCSYSSKRAAGDQYQSKLYANLTDIVRSLGAVAVVAIEAFAKLNRC